MNALKRFKYTNPRKELDIPKHRKIADNYFNYLYPKILTEEAIKYLLDRVLKHKSDKNSRVKRLGRKCVKDHPEIFDHSSYEDEQNERTDDEDDFNGVVFVQNIPENTTENVSENSVENDDKNNTEIEELKEEIKEVSEMWMK